MKPPRFRYYDPGTLEEAVALLHEYGEEAKILAGGQSLVPMLNMRLVHPRVIVDINRVRDLDFIRIEDGVLVFGAMARQYLLERETLVRDHVPLLSEAARYIGHVPIRHRGTVGGSLAHADPAAELPAAALALDAEVVAVGTSGRRTIPARAFFRAPLTTALSADEVLTEVRIPLPQRGTGWAFQEVARRHGDFALAGAAALVRLDGDGRIAEARVAVTGVAATALRLPDLEAALVGSEPTEAVLADHSRLAAVVVEVDDLHATAAYRKRALRTVTARALKLASRRAGGDGP
jgi:carbon-monoxide dehydrogenase medium subunit